MRFSHVAIIYNPNSGRPRERRTAVAQLADRLTEAGCTVEVHATERPHHATELARQAIARGADLALAHGGDGTMNEVLQAVVGTDAALGFWPGGTANVLAAEIGFPKEPDQVAERILAGQTKPVTVGRANERYFLMMAGVGVDAAVAEGVDPTLKRRLGKAAFGVAALQFLWRWDPAKFKVRLPGEELTGIFAVAGNGHSYGGGFKVTPTAELDDPELDLCIYQDTSRMGFLKFALAAVVGRHMHLAGVAYRKVSQAAIIPESGDTAPVQLDGEVMGAIPLTLEAVPGGVNLLV